MPDFSISPQSVGSVGRWGAAAEGDARSDGRGPFGADGFQSPFFVSPAPIKVEGGVRWWAFRRRMIRRRVQGEGCRLRRRAIRINPAAVAAPLERITHVAVAPSSSGDGRATIPKGFFCPHQNPIADSGVSEPIDEIYRAMLKGRFRFEATCEPDSTSVLIRRSWLRVLVDCPVLSMLLQFINRRVVSPTVVSYKIIGRFAGIRCSVTP